jgi:hypothetical protein
MVVDQTKAKSGTVILESGVNYRDLREKRPKVEVFCGFHCSSRSLFTGNFNRRTAFVCGYGGGLSQPSLAGRVFPPASSPSSTVSKVVSGKTTQKPAIFDRYEPTVFQM